MQLYIYFVNKLQIIVDTRWKQTRYWVQIVLKGKKILRCFPPAEEKRGAADNEERRRVPIVGCPWRNGYVGHNGTATGGNVLQQPGHK